MPGYRQLLHRLLKACVQSGDSPRDLDTSAAATSIRIQATPVFKLYLHGINKL
jgi:hypothetical protein